MDIESILDELPKGSILYKRSNGLWYFYENEDELNIENPLIQHDFEDTKEFLREINDVLKHDI